MTDFFTLNPRYERYELGVYPLEYETVYGVERHPLGRTLLSAVFVVVMGTVLAKYDMAFSGRTPTPSLDIVLTIALVVCAVWVIPTEIISLFRTLKINKSYERLVRDGILIEGQIFEIRVREQKPHLLGSLLNKPQTKGLYFVDFIYKFTSHDQQQVFGKQTIVSTYTGLNDQTLPPDGTPIRILYADDNTHVML